MKIKKYLSVFLIVLMVATVVSAAGVLSAQKAAAQVPGDTPIDVQYIPGKTYVFLPWRYNAHFAGFTPIRGTPQHFEFSKLGTAYSLVKTAPTQEGSSSAYVATHLRLNGITSNDLNDPTKTCTVTMLMSYRLAARGTGYTTAQFFTLPTSSRSSESVWGTDADHAVQNVKYGTRTITHTGPLSDIFGTTGEFSGRVSVHTLALQGSDNVHPPAVAAQASASVTFHYITLTFN